MPDDEERGISVVEERDVQDTSISFNELIKRDPLLFIDAFINDIHFLVICCKTDLLFKLANVSKNVHLISVKLMILIFELRTHKIPVNLKFKLQVFLVCLSICRHVIEILTGIVQNLDLLMRDRNDTRVMHSA